MNNSVDDNQPEENVKDLEGKKALEKVKELAEGAETCFFCTSIKTGLPVSVRPMALQQVDDEGNVWFMSAKDSQKNEEIAKDPFVHLMFAKNKHAGFLNLYGVAEISFDQAKIDELWTPSTKVWFTEGKEDPRISLIKVTPTQGHYWDTKNGAVIALAKMAFSLVSGKTFDDGVEGAIDLP